MEPVSDEKFIRDITAIVRDGILNHGLWPARLLCPWNSLGQKTGVGFCSPLRGIFRPWDQTRISGIAGRFFTVSRQGSPQGA